VFVILFLSSAFFPRQLMLEPASSVAEWNPLSFMVEAMREPIISTFSTTVIAKGIVSIGGVAALSLLFSAFALRHRLRAG
jgi:ABC-2 type transport system permease protein